MFGIGGPELIFILVLALLLFGPKRLPEIGRTIGKGMAEFRRASTELQRAIHTELAEPGNTETSRRPSLLDEIAGPPPGVAAPAPPAALPSVVAPIAVAGAAAHPHPSADPDAVTTPPRPT